MVVRVVPSELTAKVTIGTLGTIEEVHSGAEPVYSVDRELGDDFMGRFRRSDLFRLPGLSFNRAQMVERLLRISSTRRSKTTVVRLEGRKPAAFPRSQASVKQELGNEARRATYRKRESPTTSGRE